MAVERIKKRAETHELGRLKLYRDDLEAIARALSEFGDLNIRVNDELTGTEPEDFAKMRDELPERLKLVHMLATKEESVVAVELGKGAKVGLIEPDMAARGVLTSVEKICETHRVTRGRIRPSIAVLGILFGLVVGILANSLETLEGLGWGAALLLAAIVLVVLIPGSLLESKNSPGEGDVIINVPRAERPTFGQRLVADGGVSAFWTVVGALLGLPLGVIASLIATRLTGS